MGSPVSAKTVTKTATVHAVITRADGTVENLGLVSYYSRNPLRRWGYALGKFLGIWRR
jgi:hypothetical protein